MIDGMKLILTLFLALIVLFNYVAVFIAYRITTKSWESKEDGTFIAIELILVNFALIGIIFAINFASV